jgi:hypothetical protein
MCDDIELISLGKTFFNSLKAEMLAHCMHLWASWMFFIALFEDSLPKRADNN